MPTAFVFVPAGDRLDACIAGLTRHGFAIAVNQMPVHPGPDDIALTWSRHGRRGIVCSQVEAVGGRALIIENGYCGADRHGYQYLALALHRHAGAGEWRAAVSSHRWRALNITPRVWRASGDHVLVCASRGIGCAVTAMPASWPKTVMTRLRAVTDRPIRLRPHPGPASAATAPPLAEDLRNAHAVVVWASNAGTHALLAGVPVFHDMAGWILAPAARQSVADIERPNLGDREAAFTRLSWAQWNLEEIRAGEPFAHLLEL